MAIHPRDVHTTTALFPPNGDTRLKGPRPYANDLHLGVRPFIGDETSGIRPRRTIAPTGKWTASYKTMRTEHPTTARAPSIKGTLLSGLHLQMNGAHSGARPLTGDKTHGTRPQRMVAPKGKGTASYMIMKTKIPTLYLERSGRKARGGTRTTTS